MRRHLTRHLPLMALIALLGTGAALAATVASVTVNAAHNATLNTSILVNQSRKTLYHLTSEHGKKVVCTSPCAATWPPLTVPKGAKPAAGPGITKKKLGTITRPDGKTQVTYAGLTLYRYAGDSKAGQTNGEGLDNVWYAISPAGGLVKSASSPPTDTGGGYGYPP